MLWGGLRRTRTGQTALRCTEGPTSILCRSAQDLSKSEASYKKRKLSRHSRQCSHHQDEDKSCTRSFSLCARTSRLHLAPFMKEVAQPITSGHSAFPSPTCERRGAAKELLAARGSPDPPHPNPAPDKVVR